MGYRPLVLGSPFPGQAICITPGLASWATYGAGLDLARLREVVYHARRYYRILREVGLVKEPQPSTE
jgi:transposase